MPVVIYTCGAKSPSRSWIKGPPPIADAVKINARCLPNPHSHVCNLSNRMSTAEQDKVLDEVEAFLKREKKDMFDKLVKKGVAAVQDGRAVIVQCLYGEHRSKAVARAIQKECGKKVKWVEHVD